MTYYDKEMEKLEKQQRELRLHQEQGEWDRYNTVDVQVDRDNFETFLNSSLEFAPKKGAKWSDYTKEVQVYAKINAKKNIKTHIECKRQWYTHRSPLGCFMCEDTNLISILVHTIEIMSAQFPDQKF